MQDLLKAAKRQHYFAAGNWLFYTVILGALPFWGLALIFWLAAQELGAGFFFAKAELAVYAAGLMAGSIPAMQKEVRDSPYRHPRWFLGASMIVIVVAALAFGGVSVAPGQFDVQRLAMFSILLTSFALVLGFFSALVSEIREDPNLWSVRERQVEDLGERVRNKLKGHN